ncbi:hypothetical protein [Acinetobacter radioresistens]|uniref:hypothetical protein n=1 Tax=Acinetobacter radioresistens TaxID=40216 RepID=UPI00207756EC|nr:hypothetical protein [Acinetobacter radioresistens]
MKDQNDNKTVNWVSRRSKASSLGRGIEVLLVVKNTPVSTSKEIQSQVMSGASLRTVQRYLSELEEMGLVRKHGCSGGFRYYLSGQAKQLFGVQG